MRLSKRQIRALQTMRDNGGIADTFKINGATGHSLWKRGLCYKHRTDGDDYGTGVSYEITAEGLRQLIAESEA
jgi:hypothetical protein